MSEEKEIKKIIQNISYLTVDSAYTRDYLKLIDYIEQLQQENTSLKEKLNCKEILSSTMPEDTDFIILTKSNYERQQKDIELENIKLKHILNELESWLEENLYMTDFLVRNEIGKMKIDDLLERYKIFMLVSKKLKELKGSDE